MNKKILIGSIIAVVILVLVSFTGVVGYQTTKSSTITKTSPLFTVRSKRAIDEESKDIACDYIGRGEESVLSIPKRNDTKIKMEKVLDILTKMDDKIFNNFIKKIIQDKRVKDRDIQTITKELFHLRNTYKEKPLPLTSDFPFLCSLKDLFFALVYIYMYTGGIFGLIFAFFWAINWPTFFVTLTCYPSPYCYPYP